MCSKFNDQLLYSQLIYCSKSKRNFKNSIWKIYCKLILYNFSVHCKSNSRYKYTVYLQRRILMCFYSTNHTKCFSVVFSRRYLEAVARKNDFSLPTKQFTDLHTVCLLRFSFIQDAANVDSGQKAMRQLTRLWITSNVC